MEKTKKPQLQNIVILRSFAITMVVLYHCFCPFMISWDWCPNEYYSRYLYVLSFIMDGRMPLFIFVSGYLFSHLIIDRGKYEDFKGFISNKFKRLLVPCLSFMGIMCLALRENYFHHLIGYGFHLWFLKVLFLCFLLCWILHKYVKDTRIEIVVLLITILVMGMPMIKIWALGQFFKKFVFFYLGYLTYKHSKTTDKIINTKIGIIILSLAFVTICLVGFFIFNTLCWDNSIDYRELLLYKILTIIGMGFVTPFWGISVVNAIINRKPDFQTPQILSKVNNMSYGIYLFHVFYLQIIEKYCKETFIQITNAHYFISPFVLFVIIMAISILSTIVVKKMKFGAYMVG